MEKYRVPLAPATASGSPRPELDDTTCQKPDATAATPSAMAEHKGSIDRKVVLLVPLAAVKATVNADPQEQNNCCLHVSDSTPQAMNLPASSAQDTAANASAVVSSDVPPGSTSTAFMRAAFQQQPIHVSASDAQALPQHEIVQGLQEHTAAAHAVATTQATAAPALSPGSTPETTDKSIARRGSRRRSSLLRKKEHVLTKNYIEIARDFTLMQAFNRLPDGTYPPDTKCVFCGVGVPVAVFFPCQHRCVCDMCINRHSIAPANRKPSARSQCPVCMAEIRLILPHTGKEEEQYWAWVMEVQPQLPSYFKQEFKDAAKRLRKNSVAPTNNSHWSSSDTAADRQRRHCSIL